MRADHCCGFRSGFDFATKKGRITRRRCAQETVPNFVPTLARKWGQLVRLTERIKADLNY